MVPVVRAFVRAFLEEHPLARDAELVASEYAANAIRHTASGDGGAMHLTVTATPLSVRIEVTDRGPMASQPETVPTPRTEIAEDDESGRGLLIVDSLATRWGHYGVAGSYATAWAVLGEAAGDATDDVEGGDMPGMSGAGPPGS